MKTTFKKLLIVTFLSFTTLFISCSESEDVDTSCSEFVWELEQLFDSNNNVTEYRLYIGDSASTAVSTVVNQTTYEYYDNNFVIGQPLCWEGAK